jgi:hypothetical protein
MRKTLQAIVDRDPEQEVRGIALPAIDALISYLRGQVGSDPVVDRIAEAISVDAVVDGEPLRAVDALVVFTALAAKLPNSSISFGRTVANLRNRSCRPHVRQVSPNREQVAVGGALVLAAQETE